MLKRWLRIGSFMFLALGVGLSALATASARASADETERDSATAGKEGAEGQKDDPAEAHPARRALEREVPKLGFDRKPFDEAVPELAEACRATIYVDRATLEKAGAELDTPVSVKPAAGQTAKAVLEDLLKQVRGGGGGPGGALSYGTWGEVVLISTERHLKVTRTQMDRPLPEVQFAGVALTDALTFLRDVTSARIMVDWKRLDAAGVRRDTPVTVNLRSVTFADAVSAILMATGAKEPLAFVPVGGQVVVTRRDAVAATLADPDSLLPPDAPPAAEGDEGL